MEPLSYGPPYVIIWLFSPCYLRYRWYKDGVEFDINGTTVAERGEGGTIVLDGNKDIGGYYQCVASNQWGKALSNNTYLPRARK